MRVPALIDASRARDLLPLPELIEAVGVELSARRSTPPRTLIRSAEATWLVMPATYGQRLVCKILRAKTPDVRAATEATVAGAVAFVSASGEVEALVDAATFTARRTAAAAAYATDRLARRDASVLALFGAGALAEPHVEALDVVRPLREVRVVARTSESAERLALRLATRGWAARPAAPADALRGADLVVTATTSSTSVFADGDLEAGTHVNAMGAYLPHQREVPGATVARAQIVVESRAAAWAEAGDLILAREGGLIPHDTALDELGESDAIDRLRPANPEAVTLFKSVGHVAFDLAAARLILDRLAPTATSASDVPPKSA